MLLGKIGKQKTRSCIVIGVDVDARAGMRKGATAPFFVLNSYPTVLLFLSIEYNIDLSLIFCQLGPGFSSLL